ncbi:MAG: alpha/beta hydrolase-fold protein [Flavobacteriales bacterium]|nr:MAG: alpha/beta hydrolase-fold protein [Flavobacteriales bacterium]
MNAHRPLWGAIAAMIVGLSPGLRAQVSSKPLVVGEVLELQSAVLGEQRVLNVVLPHGYSPDGAARYPVIFVLDGGLDEDILHTSGAVQFAAFPWVAWMPQSIVVGVVSIDRKRDFTHPTSIAKDKADFPTAGGSAAFLRFLAEEAIPSVDARFRTEPRRMLIGQSLGGLFATEVLMERPDLFTDYLIVSPSLWWDDGTVLRRDARFTADRSLAPARVFVAVGREHPVMVKGAKRLADLVRRSPRTRVGFARLSAFDHAAIMHQALLDGLRWMAEGGRR